MIGAAVMPEPSIRRATAADRAALIAMMTAFQDFETTLHANRRPGAEIAADYLAILEREVAAKRGAILVAEHDGAAVGFVCCWAGHDDDELIHAETRPHGYIADVFVTAAERGRGVGGALIAAAEAYLAGLGFARVRLITLAANTAACAVYEHLGYRAYEITYEKPLGGKPR